VRTSVFSQRPPISSWASTGIIKILGDPQVKMENLVKIILTERKTIITW